MYWCIDVSVSVGVDRVRVWVERASPSTFPVEKSIWERRLSIREMNPISFNPFLQYHHSYITLIPCQESIQFTVVGLLLLMNGFGSNKINHSIARWMNQWMNDSIDRSIECDYSYTPIVRGGQTTPKERGANDQPTHSHNIRTRLTPVTSSPAGFSLFHSFHQP